MNNQLRSSLAKQAHVWIFHVHPWISNSTLTKYKTILSSGELCKYHNFRFDKDRYLFLVAHANLRLLLSRYATINPRDWEFERNEYDRPEIAQSLKLENLRFNMSHCSGLVAYIVNEDIDGGIDVERTDRVQTDPMQIAKRFFSPLEIHNLKGCDSNDAMLKRFFEYWTLKEAFVKANGLGFSMQIEQFSFHIHKDNPIQINFSNNFLLDNPQVWQFLLRYPTANHILAVALKRGYDPDFSIVVRNSEVQ